MVMPSPEAEIISDELSVIASALFSMVAKDAMRLNAISCAETVPAASASADVINISLLDIAVSPCVIIDEW